MYCDRHHHVVHWQIAGGYRFQEGEHDSLLSDRDIDRREYRIVAHHVPIQQISLIQTRS